jgi:exosortase/archaeosortase family protein
MLIVSSCAAFLIADVFGLSPLAALLQPVATGTAVIVTYLLESMQFSVVRIGSVVTAADGFSYHIDYRCTGLLPAAILAILVASEEKIIGTGRALGVSVVIVWLLNLVRLLQLFAIGVTAPRAFDLVHGLIWPLLWIAVIVALWQMSRRLFASPHSSMPAKRLRPEPAEYAAGQ